MTEISLPVARVYVDLGLPHLDRPFDYAVPPEMDQTAVVGSRVRVRFAGRIVSGFVVERVAVSQQESLAPLARSVSAEPVLPPVSAALVRAVADHYGGTFSDVVRLAVPPRHASTETAPVHPAPEWTPAPVEPGALGWYPQGEAFLARLRAGGSPRAAWTVVPAAAPVGDWAGGITAAAVATLASGRSAVVVVPDTRDVTRVASVVEAGVGKAWVVRQTAELGASARYRAFLRGLRGQARVVVGTRSAVFAPVVDLGLLCVWDDGDDLHAEQRAPYPHARDVAAIRSNLTGAALLIAAYGRTCEVQSWVERGWLAPIDLAPDRVRRLAPAVRVSRDDDAALDRDPAARVARLPREAFTVARAGLAQGPVLVQVPRAGYLAAISCAGCGSRARCPACGGPLRSDRGLDRPVPQLGCRWCGRVVTGWRCGECEGTRLRSTQVGAERTAEELGRAFPGVVVRRSAQDRVLDQVDAEPALVVATPGAEPPAEGGYAAALLLDANTLLGRPDLRAGEEAVRRWLRAVALVRPGADGGTVLLVGPHQSRAVQALLRLDPAGFASRELAERAEAGFPPAVRFLVAEGEWNILTELAQALAVIPESAALGPAAATDQTSRLFARAPLSAGAQLSRAVQSFQAGRSARKDQRRLRVQVDPAAVE